MVNGFRPSIIYLLITLTFHGLWSAPLLPMTTTFLQGHYAIFSKTPDYHAAYRTAWAYDGPAEKSYVDFVGRIQDDTVMGQFSLPIPELVLATVHLRPLLGHRAYLGLIPTALKFPVHYSQFFGGLTLENRLIGEWHFFSNLMFLKNDYVDGSPLRTLQNTRFAANTLVWEVALLDPVGIFKIGPVFLAS